MSKYREIRKGRYFKKVVLSVNHIILGQPRSSIEMKNFLFPFSPKKFFCFRKNLLIKINENEENFRKSLHENAKQTTFINNPKSSGRFGRLSCNSSHCVSTLPPPPPRSAHPAPTAQATIHILYIIYMCVLKSKFLSRLLQFSKSQECFKTLDASTIIF
jgi:hypothetical protein